MFALWRSFTKRFRKASSAHDERRKKLYAEERALAKAFRELFHAYERRLAYLEGRLLHESDEELERDATLFEEANEALGRVLHRLRFADAEEEALLREWHDWHKPHASAQDLKKYGDRLELLRSELAVRKRLPMSAEKRSEPIKPAKKRVQQYVPTALSDDAFEAFDRVYRPRLHAHRTHAERAHHQLHKTVHHPVRAIILAKRVKHAHGLEKRFRRVLGG